MKNINSNTENNIQKLISSSLNEEGRLEPRYKELVLEMLIKKLDQQKRESQPAPISLIGLSMLWIVSVVWLFSGFADSVYILDLVKVALGLSLLSIPASGIVLIVLKLQSNEKRMV